MVTLLMVDNFSITHPRADAAAGSRGATPPSARPQRWALWWSPAPKSGPH